MINQLVSLDYRKSSNSSWKNINSKWMKMMANSKKTILHYLTRKIYLNGTSLCLVWMIHHMKVDFIWVNWYFRLIIRGNHQGLWWSLKLGDSNKIIVFVFQYLIITQKVGLRSGMSVQILLVSLVLWFAKIKQWALLKPQ